MTCFNYTEIYTREHLQQIVDDITPYLVPRVFSKLEVGTEHSETDDVDIYLIYGYDDSETLVFKLRNRWYTMYGKDIPQMSLYNKQSGTWTTNSPTSYDPEYINAIYACDSGIYIQMRIGSYTYPGRYVVCKAKDGSVVCVRKESDSTAGATINVYSTNGNINYTTHCNDTDNHTGSYYLLPYPTKTSILDGGLVAFY